MKYTKRLARLERRRKAFDEMKSVGSGPKPTDKLVLRGTEAFVHHRPGSQKK
jgi:hypothetical protein